MLNSVLLNYLTNIENGGVNELKVLGCSNGIQPEESVASF